MRGLAEHFCGVDALHDLAVGQHGDDRIYARHRIRDAGEGRAAIVLSLAQRVSRKIEGVDRVAGLHEVRGHAAAHVAEADECDFHMTPPPASGRGRGWAILPMID